MLLNDDLTNTKKSFQDGVDSIYNMLVSLGFTPSGKDLDSIKKSIQKVYDDRYTSGNTAGYNNGYNNGYNEGNTAGYASGYSDGRTQGQEDVKSNPGDYGVSTSKSRSVYINVLAKYSGGHNYITLTLYVDGVSKTQWANMQDMVPTYDTERNRNTSTNNVII